VRQLDIKCKKVNLFIGEPNTGKSNLLEALGLLSWCGNSNPPVQPPLKDFVRLQGMQNIFYDELLDQPVEIKLEGEIKLHLKITFKDDVFCLENLSPKTKDRIKKWALDYTGNPKEYWPNISELAPIKFYRFKEQDNFPERMSSFLFPPHGSNLFSVVMAHKKLRETMAGFFRDFGFNLVFKPQEKAFEIQKQQENMVFTYPYRLTSDTLQRIIFYVIAIESNSDSTLVFEEPESHAFPYYTKYLGEKIAFDETNQYFIATHNPYLLLSILEKARKDDVGVFVTYFRDYETRFKLLTNEQLSELMDYDPFFNLNSFIEEEK
ncbi:MAG: AAA family ATPase, partial [Thermoplasmata archaeon]|nr:AAA family ATPase [Thermoplasmata archaeon]